ncbi:MAG: class I SAM-dependent methyltransferase [Chloroflexi bacterium]|nr:MAG: class I SAM-dependent methyltransferase [Chloroflexota bacterium]
MLPSTASFLLDLNRRFYADFGPSFAATRRRIQDGVRRILGSLPDAPVQRWLDLGCGSGPLAVEWLRHGRQSAYLGLDFSDSLLEEARAAVAGMPGSERVTFGRGDLSDPNWASGLEPGFNGILAFASLHHLPSQGLREQVLRQVRNLLDFSNPAGAPARFIHSEWQFQNSPKLMARRVPWESAGLRESDLEPGDTLLDWRAAIPGQPESVGLRYVHLFDRDELAGLASAAGFRILEEFESDGEGGRLGLYQVWEPV